jgi:hypothetical protein
MCSKPQKGLPGRPDLVDMSHWRRPVVLRAAHVGRWWSLRSAVLRPRDDRAMTAASRPPTSGALPFTVAIRCARILGDASPSLSRRPIADSPDGLILVVEVGGPVDARPAVRPPIPWCSQADLNTSL